jgi:hypothetical protein
MLRRQAIASLLAAGVPVAARARGMERYFAWAPRVKGMARHGAVPAPGMSRYERLA